MLTATLVFLLLLVALLAIPLTLTFKMSWPKALQEDARLEWAFGLVKLRVPASAIDPQSSGACEPVRKTHIAGRSFGQGASVLAVFRLEPFRRRVIRFIGDLWRAIHKNDLSLSIRVGLGDPADTGQLWAAVGPAAALLGNVQGAAIVIEPDFSDSTFEMNSAGSLRLVPLQLLYIFVALLLSPSIWRGVVRMRAGGG